MLSKEFDLTKFGTKISSKIKYKGIQEHIVFTDIISLWEDCYVRTHTIEMYGLNTQVYDEPFYAMIENLTLLKYGKVKSNIILWWLYDRWGRNGDLKELPNKWRKHSKSSDNIYIESPFDLWELINNIE